MSTAELKLDLLDKLASINDEKILNQVHLLLKDIDVNINPYKLNNEQINMIRESESDCISGKLRTNDDVFKNDEEWLKTCSLD